MDDDDTVDVAVLLDMYVHVVVVCVMNVLLFNVSFFVFCSH